MDNTVSPASRRPPSAKGYGYINNRHPGTPMCTRSIEEIAVLLGRKDGKKSSKIQDGPPGISLSALSLFSFRAKPIDE